MHHINAAKRYCDHGHEFIAATTYVDPQGYRQCRACRRERSRRYRYGPVSPVRAECCAQCGDALHQPDVGRPATYCSPACRSRAQRRKAADRLTA